MANIITEIRIVLSAALLFRPALSPGFYALYIAAGFSDMIDGAVARRTGTASELGSRLDTIADIVFVLVCLIKLLPVLSVPIWLYIWIAAVRFSADTDLHRSAIQCRSCLHGCDSGGYSRRVYGHRCIFVRRVVMELKIIDYELTVCKIDDPSMLDLGKDFYFIGKTDEELSLVCKTEDTPDCTRERDDGWKCFRIQGVLDFSLIGILSRISGILADNKIGIFAVSTYNTDYILVKSENFGRAIDALGKEGYTIV